MENPRYEHIQPKVAASKTVEHRIMATRSRNKLDLLKNVLVGSQPYWRLFLLIRKQQLMK